MGQYDDNIVEPFSKQLLSKLKNELDDYLARHKICQVHRFSC